MANVKKLKIKDTTYSLDAYNADSATKLKTARSIALGTGATGTATNFDGSSNITIPVTSVKESYLDWGGKSISGGVSPIGASLSSEHSANRLAYLNPNALSFEYSDNGGSTWSTLSVSNDTKIGFVTTSGSFTVGNASTVTTNHRSRVTITAQNGTTGYVYTRPRKLLLNVSTCGHGLSVLIETKTGATNASWNTVGTYSLSGWSGWNDIPLSFSTLGGSKGQTSNIWYMRLTFAITSVNSNYSNSRASIIGMRLFGDTCWTKTSNMGETGHLYSYDSAQNATFPAKVTATGFSGPLTGNATTASGIKDSANSSTITASYASAQLAYSDITHLACWNGYQLRAINKNAFVGNNSDSISAALNRLGIGTDTPSDNDFYICQYAGGGTTTTSYHRRPVYALWDYIKGKTDNAYVAKGTIATTSAAGLMSSDDKSKLDGIAAGANNYSLPNATSSTLGGVKVGSNITVNSGTISLTKANVTSALGYTPPTSNTTYSIATTSTPGLVKPVSVITKPTLNSVTTTSGRYYSVQMSSDGSMFVNVPWQAVPNDYYHSTGSWDGLTYTATAHEGAPELKFTLPTGTTATTVARGDHTHSQYVTSDSKTSSSNTTNKIYLVGATSQSSAGQTTYSNSSCYASGGYLYSNGKKVDMDNISGGVEWSTF